MVRSGPKERCSEDPRLCDGVVCLAGSEIRSLPPNQGTMVDG